MGRLQKRMVDIGPGSEQVGLGITEDTEKRQLVSTSDPQTIKGEKTFLSPPRSSVYPIVSSDAVPKKALLENTRCSTGTVTDIIVVTAEDIRNGYVSLSNSIAPGKAASLEIVEFEGAPGLALNQDFGVKTNPDGSMNKLQWQGWPLGRPGRMIEGQRMIVRYDVCRQSLYEEIDVSRMFIARVEDKADPDSFINERINRNHIVTSDDSEKHLELMRLSDGEVIRVKLPRITGNSGLGLTCAGGKLLLYTTPTPQFSSVGREGGNNMLLARKPFITGAFKIYEYDGAVWDLKLTDDMLPEFEALGDVSMYSRESHAPLLLDVLPVGKNKLGLYRAWRTADLTFYPDDHNNTVYGDNIELYSDLKVFDVDYRYVETKRVRTSADSRQFAFYSACAATDNVFIPTSFGVRASGSSSWPVYGPYGDNGLPYWLVPLIEDLCIGIDYDFLSNPDVLGLCTAYSPSNPDSGLIRTLWGPVNYESLGVFIRGDLALIKDENHLGVFDIATHKFKDLSGSDIKQRYRDAEAQNYRGLLVLAM